MEHGRTGEAGFKAARARASRGRSPRCRGGTRGPPGSPLVTASTSSSRPELRAVELAQLHPLGVAVGHLRVDLAEQLVAVADEDRRRASSSSRRSGRSRGRRRSGSPAPRPRARRTTFSASPSGSTIGSSQATRSCSIDEPLVEPVGVLVARLDVLHLAPRELLVEQSPERLALERACRPPSAARRSATSERGQELGRRLRGRHLARLRPPGRPATSASPTPKLKSSGRSQKPRNSAAQRGESLHRLRVPDLDRLDQLAGEHPLALARPTTRAPAGRARAAAREPRRGRRPRRRTRRTRPRCGPRRRRARPPRPGAERVAEAGGRPSSPSGRGRRPRTAASIVKLSSFSSRSPSIAISAGSRRTARRRPGRPRPRSASSTQVVVADVVDVGDRAGVAAEEPLRGEQARRCRGSGAPRRACSRSCAATRSSSRRGGGRGRPVFGLIRRER